MDGSSSTRAASDWRDRRYDDLPGVLRRLYTPEEYAWLDDMRKRELQRIETEPEWSEP